ncbi:MAG: ABC transporter permease [Planctomycetota bacterium]
MPPSWQLARNELTGRRSRIALLVAAVALAASLVTAVTCAIGTVQGSVERGLENVIGATDARVIHEFNGRFDSGLLEEIRGWPEVRLASARFYETLSLRRADGKLDPETQLPLQVSATAIGGDAELEQAFRPIELERGRWPDGMGEIAVDAITAERLEVTAGDLVAMPRFGDMIELEVVGVYRRPTIILGFLQKPQVRLYRPALEALTDREGEINGIMILVHEGVDVEAFCTTYAERVPGYLSLEPALKLRSGFDRRLKASRLGMVIGAVLTFMSAAFIIVTGMTTAVTERQREMAVLRCVGAERRQLFAAQILFGGLIGAMGATAGVPLGLAVARLLAWIYREELGGDFHIVPLGVVLAIIGSIGAGLLGALFPAWEASRTAPLRAMTRGGRPPSWRSVIACTAIGAALVGLQLGLLTIADVDQRFWAYAYVGLPSLYIAYFLLSVPLTVAVARAVAPLLSAVLRLPRGMLWGSVQATPLRHGFTAGALMVGMSLLVATWAEANGLLDDWVNAARFADGFAYRRAGIDPGQQEAIDELPFVERSCPIGYLPLQVVGQRVFGLEEVTPPYVICIGFDPERFFAMNDVSWREGDLQSALPKLRSGEGILVADRFTIARGIGVGDHLTLGGQRMTKEYEIVGSVNSAGLDISIELFGVRNAYSEFAVSCVFMDFETVKRDFDNGDALLVQVDLSDDVDDLEAERRVIEAAPGSRFYSGRWIMDTIDQIAFAMLTVQNAVAFAALLLACLGVGNVILANIHSRRFEYGVMRAVGASRALLLRLILAEATLLALGAAVAGTILGMHIASVSRTHYRDLMGLEISIALPPLPTAIGVAVLLLMTFAASLPGVAMVVRPRPSALVAAGRNG